MMRRTVLLAKRLLLLLIVGLTGFVGGLLLLYILTVRSGPALDVWHTADLSREFTAPMADREVATFEAYLKLEEALFAQLEQQVYQVTETGPEYTLARYSAGSAADPHTWDRNWNRSFELPSTDPVGSVLLLHGMSDSPYSLRDLGLSLHAQGYRVLGLRLPGHGTAPSGLLDTTWQDMAAATRLAASYLAPDPSAGPLHLVGYSTGAPLAVNHVLATLDDDSGLVPPASLVLISPSIGITPYAALAKWKRRLAQFPGLKQVAWNSILPEFDPFKYNSFTANAGAQVHELTTFLNARLSAKAAAGPIEGFPPALVFLSTVDATVSTDAVIDGLLTHFLPGAHELVLFDINRSRIKKTILASDPGPLTARLLVDTSLPFQLTIVGSESPDSREVATWARQPGSEVISMAPLDLSWPPGVISLSHVALPFAPDDPLYGRREFAPSGRLHLGQIDFQGERNLLKFPADWLLRLRHNPFYEYLEDRSLEWIDEAGSR